MCNELIKNLDFITLSAGTQACCYVENTLTNVGYLGIAIFMELTDLATQIGALAVSTFSRGCCQESRVDDLATKGLWGASVRVLPAIYDLALGLFLAKPETKELPLLVQPMLSFIENWAEDISFSENWLTKEIGARLAWLSVGLAVTVMKVMELTLGIILAGLSFLFFGHWEELTSRAYSSLFAANFIEDLLLCLSLTINPTPMNLSQ